MNRGYREKTSDYFAHANLRLASKITGTHLHLFDVGCGQAALVRVLAERGQVEKSYAVELVPEAAEVARQFVTELWNESIETFLPPIPTGSLDYIICADVLEHLRDPEAILLQLEPLLKRDGRLLVSLPNASNRRLLWDLAIRNDWRYAPSGIMDATHLRWFTRNSAHRMLETSGFQVLDFDYVFWGKGGALLDKVSFGSLARFVAAQLLFVATPVNRKG